MKGVLLAAAAAALFGMTLADASADQYVNGYTRRDGTYVQPHYQTSPNATPYDNYSTRGNINPYTGQPGTQSPYGGSSLGASPYGTQPTNPYANPYGSGSRRNCVGAYCN
jgi:hypothetical protein